MHCRNVGACRGVPLFVGRVDVGAVLGHFRLYDHLVPGLLVARRYSILGVLEHSVLFDLRFYDDSVAFQVEHLLLFDIYVPFVLRVTFLNYIGIGDFLLGDACPGEHDPDPPFVVVVGGLLPALDLQLDVLYDHLGVVLFGFLMLFLN